MPGLNVAQRAELSKKDGAYLSHPRVYNVEIGNTRQPHLSLGEFLESKKSSLFGEGRASVQSVELSGLTAFAETLSAIGIRNGTGLKHWSAHQGIETVYLPEDPILGQTGYLKNANEPLIAIPAHPFDKNVDHPQRKFTPEVVRTLLYNSDIP
jgi:hypothetical protein